MTTPLFSLKINPAEEDDCPCQRSPEKQDRCQGSEAVLLSELRSKDGPHLDEVLLANSNPWATTDLYEFNSRADRDRRAYEGGYVQMVRNNGPRLMDLDE